MYYQTGSCPHCGAPIWVKREIDLTSKDERLSKIDITSLEDDVATLLPPQPIFTCNCVSNEEPEAPNKHRTL